MYPGMLQTSLLKINIVERMICTTYNEALSALRDKLVQSPLKEHILSCMDYNEKYIFTVNTDRPDDVGVMYTFDKKNGVFGRTNMMELYMLNDRTGLEMAIKNRKIIDKM